MLKTAKDHQSQDSHAIIVSFRKPKKMSRRTKLKQKFKNLFKFVYLSESQFDDTRDLIKNKIKFAWKVSRIKILSKL